MSLERGDNKQSEVSLLTMQAEASVDAGGGHELLGYTLRQEAKYAAGEPK